MINGRSRCFVNTKERTGIVLWFVGGFFDHYAFNFAKSKLFPEQ